MSVIIWFVCFPAGVLWCCGCLGLWRVLFVPSSVVLCVFAYVVWGFFGLARFLLAASPLVLPRVSVVSCDDPVVVWSVPS